MYPLYILILVSTAIGVVFAIPVSRPPTSSGNNITYSENAQIESHLSKRSFDSDAIIECLQGFTPKGGSRIVKCVSIHPKPEKHS
ncbi:hypothetical protein EAF04_010768 [Stromatinia cepivora]|nr:hypothetical protein EAF04_010768 [Stromatinia cepivora]